ncbi:hypothetical protein Athai_67110 [Actinocatenispora thailandica]|uniref:Uncharacterized protein n=1 Tax=Actinocatenispora thailandica TaxID=227318 RepID=A0A7R7DWK5_9ACTN|nr:hypothetical protein [Actinocatenispora thailandica]BCJ39208.1 hypothetical protein Athai_67110 [Actinocatenispora thailandica]
MGLTATLRRMTPLRPMIVTAPGGEPARMAVERWCDRHGWLPAYAPAQANTLVVCGAGAGEFDDAIDAVWDQLPLPRRRVTVTGPDEVDAALQDAITALRSGADAGTSGPAAPSDGRRPADGQRAAGHRDADGTPGGHRHADGEPPAAPDRPEHADHEPSGHDEHDHGGHEPDEHGGNDETEPGHGKRERGMEEPHPHEHGAHEQAGRQAGHPRDEHGGHERGEHGGHEHGTHEHAGHQAGHGGHENGGHENGGHENGGHEHGGHEHGGHEHGGHEHGGMMMPGGVAMADRGTDRDGLMLDRLHLTLGPALYPWPAGFLVRLVLQGDVVQEAEAQRLPGGPRPPTTPAVRLLDQVQALLVLAGWQRAARDGRRLRDEARSGTAPAGYRRWAARLRRSRLLRWSLAGLGRLPVEPATPASPQHRHPVDPAAPNGRLSDEPATPASPQHRRPADPAEPGGRLAVEPGAGADVYDRLSAWLDGLDAVFAGHRVELVEPDPGLLPAALAGGDLAAARLTVASLAAMPASRSAVERAR